MPKRTSKPARSHWNFDRILHKLEHRALKLAATLIVLHWVYAHLWHEFGLPTVWVNTGEQTANMLPSPSMGINNCRVTVTDIDGIEHTTEVTAAATLYEAVALGIKTIKGSEWTGQVAEGFNTVKVVSQSPKVEHAVQIGTFQKWLAQPGRTP